MCISLSTEQFSYIQPLIIMKHIANVVMLYLVFKRM